MSKKKAKVLVIATSRKTRGGITSVIKAHKTGEQWKRNSCKWIQTHRDGNFFVKILYLLSSLVIFLVLAPFYNIVHIHIATRSSAIRKKIFIYISKALKKKLILHFHPSNEKFLFEPKNQNLYKNLFAKADLVLVLAKQWEVWINMALKLNGNIKVLYNPCPKVDSRDDIRENIILVAGTIIPRKGYETIIKAFSLIANKYLNWKLVFAGNGEIEKAMSIAKGEGIEDRIQFLGWVSGNEKDLVFNKASIYCLASDGEGFPMAVLDAWAYRIPVICTPVGGLTDIVRNTHNGLLFPVNDFGKLAEQFELLIDNKQLRDSIVYETDKMVQNQFNINTINKNLDKIYLDILE